jgi:hypothetical protein
MYSDHTGILGSITGAIDYKYRWEYDILYVKAETKDAAKKDTIYL